MSTYVPTKRGRKRTIPRFKKKKKEKKKQNEDERAKRRAKTFVTHALNFVSFCYLRAFWDAGARLVTVTCQPVVACHPGFNRGARHGAEAGPPASWWVWEWARGPGSSLIPPHLHPQVARSWPGVGSPASPEPLRPAQQGSGKQPTSSAARAARWPADLAPRSRPAGLGRGCGAGPAGDVNTLTTHRRCGSPD